MHVLDFLRESKDWDVRVPLYHRGHLSLRPGTTVHVAWVIPPDSDALAAGGTSGLPEIFGSAVRQRAWSSVYRIWIALYDKPGVLNKALRSVSRHGGNVLQLDSTSTERETHHDVEMVVDFASLGDTDKPIRDLSPEIEGLLLADCAEHIVSTESGFFLTVRPVSSLRRMNNMLSKIRGAEAVSTFRVGEKGHLTLDANLRDMLLGAGVDIPFKYLVTSDTTDRVFRITFFPATQPVVWCAIRHADMKGALESITDTLQRNHISILCSLNRVQEHLGKNWFEAVLSSQAWRVTSPGENQEPPAEIVRRIMTTAEMEPYDLKVLFNPKETNEVMLQTETTKVSHGRAYMDKREDVDAWIDAREKDLTGLETKLLKIDSRDRHSAPLVRHAAALRSGIARVRMETARLKRRIFVSTEFTKKNELKIAAVQRACRKVGITFVVVRAPNKDQKVIWREVIDQMRDTTDFIGIWTPSIKAPSSSRPSPWCVWELGLANAMGIPAYVFGDHTADLADYKAIQGEHFYYDFKNMKEFEDKVMHVVQIIAKTDDSLSARRRTYPRYPTTGLR